MQVGHVYENLKVLTTQFGSLGSLLTWCEIVIVLTLVASPCSSLHTWERQGCFRVGHIRTVRIEGCVVFNVSLNACRGYCESYAFPSPSRTRQMNSKHIITSRAECCGIKQTHRVTVKVSCLDGYKTIVFRSADTCACSLCRN